MAYKVTYNRQLGWVLEVTESDLNDQVAVVLQDEDELRTLIDEFGFAYANRMAFEGWEA
jgi:hypothetical protein